MESRHNNTLQARIDELLDLGTTSISESEFRRWQGAQRIGKRMKASLVDAIRTRIEKEVGAEDAVEVKVYDWGGKWTFILADENLLDLESWAGNDTSS